MAELFHTATGHVEKNATKELILLAAAAIPEIKAQAPELIPVAMYKYCDALWTPRAQLFATTIKNNYVPKKLKVLTVAPIDKPGKYPTS